MPTTLRSGLANLAGRFTTPLLPADYLDVINPLLSGTQLRGRIVAITPETADAATLLIKPGRGWRPHIPGQYLRVGVDIDGMRHWRTYSLTSRTDDRFLSITVKAVPGGIVSNHLVRHAGVGSTIHLDQAAGDFTLGSPAPQKILFVTAGSLRLADETLGTGDAVRTGDIGGEPVTAITDCELLVWAMSRRLGE